MKYPRHWKYRKVKGKKSTRSTRRKNPKKGGKTKLGPMS